MAIMKEAKTLTFGDTQYVVVDAEAREKIAGLEQSANETLPALKQQIETHSSDNNAHCDIRDAIPTKVSQLANDSQFITQESDPTVPSWAKQETKPEYTASEVGAEPAGTSSTVVSQHNTSNVAHADIRNEVKALNDEFASHEHNKAYDAKGSAESALTEAKSYTNSKTANLASNASVSTSVNNHNTNAEAHNDIRLELKAINDRLNAFFDSDDKTLDELSEIVAYITNNKTLIDSITTSKVNVEDIINNLTTNVANKPLSAAQGVALKGLIDSVSTSLSNYQPKGNYALKSELPTKVSQLSNDSGYLTEHQDISGKLDSSALPTAINTALAQAKESGEFDGKDGKDGQDGYTPQKNVDYFDGKDGKDGSNGKDGTSATHSWNGTTLTITSASGTSSADLKGETGSEGKDGSDGADGVSPTVAVSKSGKVTTISITDKNGTKTATINDGADGSAGSAGKDGTSVTVKSVSESTADGGSNVVTFSDGKTLTVKNGSKGSTGAAGKDGKTPVKGTDYWTEADKQEMVDELSEHQEVFNITSDEFAQLTQEELAAKYADGARIVLITDDSNLVPKSINEKGEVFNGCGYLSGYRLNSSGGITESEHSVMTGFIPYTHGVEIHITGGSQTADYGGQYVNTYNDAFELIGTNYLDKAVSYSGGTSTFNAKNVRKDVIKTSSITNASINNAFKNAKYIRVALTPCVGKDMTVSYH